MRVKRVMLVPGSTVKARCELCRYLSELTFDFSVSSTTTERISIHPNSSEADRRVRLGAELVTSLVPKQFTQVATGPPPLSKDSYFHSGIGHRCGHAVLIGIDGANETCSRLHRSLEQRRGSQSFICYPLGGHSTSLTAIIRYGPGSALLKTPLLRQAIA